MKREPGSTFPSVSFALSAVVVGTLFASCASEPVRTADWSDATSVTARAGTAELVTQADFDTYAASLYSGTVCENEARGLIARQPRSATMMMRGCMRRPDFVSFLIFADQPWKTMKFTDKDLPLLLDVSMRRGGIEVAEDLSSLGFRVQNYEVRRLDPPPGKKRADVIAARGLVLDEAATAEGFVSTVRLYGFENDVEVYRYQTYDWRTRTSSEKMYTYGNERTRNVVPLGLTLKVLSREPLPKNRRIQILARVDEKRSDALKARAASVLAADPTPPGSAAAAQFHDPPAEAFVELIAREH